MAKLTKNGSSAIIEDGVVQTQFKNVTLTTRFEGLNVTLYMDGVSRYNGLLTGLLDVTDTP